ncbi:MAG: hypothetical protein ABIH99_02285 [Candidatus Micrarchaeota archaeon]
MKKHLLFSALTLAFLLLAMGCMNSQSAGGQSSTELNVSSLVISANYTDLNFKGVYRPGETVFVHLGLEGVNVEGGEVSLDAEMIVVDPEGKATESSGLLGERGKFKWYDSKVALTTFIWLPENTLPGKYSVQIKVIDKKDGKTTVTNASFEVE